HGLRSELRSAHAVLARALADLAPLRRLDRVPDVRLAVPALALRRRAVLDGRGAVGRYLLALADVDPARAAARRFPAALLHAAPHLDERVRLERDGDALALAAVRDVVR